MPLTTLNINVELAPATKQAIATATSQLFVETLKTFAQHNHVRIDDRAFIAYAGNSESPAALVQVKAAEASISRDARKALVAGFSKVLPSHIPTLSADRIYITFEELPVQNIAVGDSIMHFSTMHTAKSIDNIAEVQP